MHIKKNSGTLSGAILMIAIAGFMLFTAETASCSDKTDILAVGESRIKGNNVADARKEAISDALKKGMEEYLAIYLGTKGMVSNFSSLVNNVTPVAKEDIENFHILAEENKDDLYSILVTVKINESLIGQRLKEQGILKIESTSIKVLFLVSQERNAGKDLSFWWNSPDVIPALSTTELKLYNYFQEQGLEAVSRMSGIPDGEYSDDMKKQDLSLEDAVRWGRIFSADVIIKGKSSMADNNTVALDLEAITVEDGKTICHASRSEPINPVDAGEDRFANALGTVVNTIAGQFSTEIVRTIGKKSGESNRIQIILKDMNNFDEVRALKDFLEKEVEGVKSVLQSRIKGRSMTFSVEYSGRKDTLINRLMSGENIPFQADMTVSEAGDIIITIEHEMMEPAIQEDTIQQGYQR